MTIIDEKVIIKRVDRYGPEPTTPYEALVQARDFLAEEGQWVTGTMFRDGDPKEAYEKSFCGSWSACSMGALGLVTGEMPISVVHARQEWDGEDNFFFRGGDKSYNKRDTPLSYEASRFLAIAGEQIFDVGTYEYALDDPVDVVINYNDGQEDGEVGRTQVIEFFDKAIQLAADDKLPERDFNTGEWIWVPRT